ncbi:MAG: hypothetical protein ACO3H6_03835 [Bacilli bacterium]
MFSFTGGFIDPQSITDKLIPNGVWPLVIQLISTLILFYILNKLLYQPIKGILDKRAAYVEKHLADAAKQAKDAATLKAALEAEKLKVQKSLKSLREEALEEIEVTKTQLLSEAQQDAARLKQKTAEEIIQAKAKALADIEREIVNVALDASKQVLQRELTKQDNDKVVEDFIKGLRN